MEQSLRQEQFPGSRVFLNGQIASQNLGHFLKVLNRRAFGNAASRHGRRIPVIAVLEGTDTKHLHYHLAIDFSGSKIPQDLFPATVRDAWQSTHWGDQQIDIRPADQGWIDYITKFADKPVFSDSIDWMNTSLPT